MSKKSFIDMTPEELDKWEADTNSVVFFDELKCVFFQKSKYSKDSNGVIDMADKSLFIYVQDGEYENTLLLLEPQIKSLKEYLDKNF